MPTIRQQQSFFQTMHQHSTIYMLSKHFNNKQVPKVTEQVPKVTGASTKSDWETSALVTKNHQSRRGRKPWHNIALSRKGKIWYYQVKSKDMIHPWNSERLRVKHSNTIQNELAKMSQCIVLNTNVDSVLDSWHIRWQHTNHHNATC